MVSEQLQRDIHTFKRIMIYALAAIAIAIVFNLATRLHAEENDSTYNVIKVSDIKTNLTTHMKALDDQLFKTYTKEQRDIMDAQKVDAIQFNTLSALADTTLKVKKVQR
jgi:hypothetical protein